MRGNHIKLQWSPADLCLETSNLFILSFIYSLDYLIDHIFVHIVLIYLFEHLWEY